MVFCRVASERLIQTAFVLQRDEFTKAYRLVLRNLPTKIRMVGWVQCALLIALIVLGVAYRPDGNLQPISLLALIVVWLVFLTGQITSRAIISLQFNRMAGKEIRYEFDEMGFTDRMPESESRLSWAAVTTFLETDALFVLSSGILFYTIPKRALSSDSVASLRQLLTEKLAPSQI
jgi:hypothetical protein